MGSLDKRRSSEEQEALVEQAFNSLGVSVIQEIDAKVRLETYIEEYLRQHYVAQSTAARVQRLNAFRQALQGLDSEQVINFVQSLGE